MNPLLLLKIAPWLLLALALGWGALERDSYQKCKLATVQYQADAEKAKAEAIAQAQAKSDEQIGKLQEALTANASRSNTFTERIVQIPVTRACADSQSVRLGLEFMRSTFGNAGSGANKAITGPPTALPTAPAAAGKPNR